MCAVLATTAAAINTGGSCKRSSKQAFALGQLSMFNSHAGQAVDGSLRIHACQPAAPTSKAARMVRREKGGVGGCSSAPLCLSDCKT